MQSACRAAIEVSCKKLRQVTAKMKRKKKLEKGKTNEPRSHSEKLQY